jgi:hypothetical protein
MAGHFRRSTVLVCLLWSNVTLAQDAPVVDHEGTRFPLTGAHERVPCDGCHANAIFRGTPTRCDFCHDGTGRRAETGKNRNHIRTSNDCANCHRTQAWTGARFDHIDVSSSCRDCHDGMTATGKSSDHVKTNEDCGDCHRTLTWSGARFDHSGVGGSCASCHDGRTARGKPNDHPRTQSDCDVCHRTSTWDAARFDHSDITGRCDACHDGSTARGKDGDHFGTTRDCDRCHGVRSWDDAHYDHRSSSGYPGDHRGNLDCDDCHRNNRANNPWPFANLAPDCGGCHKDDFKRDPHKKTEDPETDYTVSELRDCSGACHIYKNGRIKDRRNNEHSVRDGDFD